MRATRRPDSAARLKALTRRAYTASAGHLDLEEEAAREFDRIVEGPAPSDTAHRAPPRRRWAVSGRAVLVVVLTAGAVAGLVLGRSLVLGPGDALPVPQVSQLTSSPDDDATASSSAPPTPGPPVPTPASTEAPAPATVVVHVAGAVAEAGLITLPAGARVGDAVAAAGGALPDAEVAAVNLARLLVDGEQVYVPRVGEPAPGAAGAPAPADAGDPAAPGEAVVDLNTADLTALDTLPGVGPAIAQRILDWRAAHGPFRSVDELLEVPGIGPATLDRLRPKVRV